MVLEGSLPYSQELTTGLNAMPDESSLRLQFVFFPEGKISPCWIQEKNCKFYAMENSKTKS
jgi:hypothetical protein